MVSFSLSYFDNFGQQLLNRLVHITETARARGVPGRACTHLLFDQQCYALRDGAGSGSRDLFAGVPFLETKAVTKRNGINLLLYADPLSQIMSREDELVIFSEVDHPAVRLWAEAI